REPGRRRRGEGGAACADPCGHHRQRREAPSGRVAIPVITVLFACVHNAGRSQIAAALFNNHADPKKARAISAGTQPAARVHPEVVAVMKQRGIDLSTAVPQKLTPELAATAQWLITMGCGDECPIVPGTRRDDWPILDP